MSRYEQFMGEILARPFHPSLVAVDPLHPWTSPDWMKGVHTSHPIAWCAAFCGRAAGGMARRAAFADGNRPRRTKAH